MLYQMILADGIIDVEELNTLSRIGEEKYAITPDQISRFIRETNINTIYPESLEDKVSLLYQLGEIAWADGHIDETETALLKKYIIKLGFALDNVQEIADFILEQVKNNVSEKDVINKILNN